MVATCINFTQLTDNLSIKNAPVPFQDNILRLLQSICNVLRNV